MGQAAQGTSILIEGVLAQAAQGAGRLIEGGRVKLPWGKKINRRMRSSCLDDKTINLRQTDQVALGQENT